MTPHSGNLVEVTALQMTWFGRVYSNRSTTFQFR